MKNLLIGIAVLALVGCGDNSTNKSAPSTANSTTTTQTTKTEVSAPAINVTADELLNGYKENELAGDQKFKGKNLVVTGKVESIQSGIGDEPFVVFKAGGDMSFTKPQAHFDKSQTAELAKLKKGATAKVQCTGNGEIAGTPMLKDCKLA